MKCPSVFRQLHAARRSVQKPDTETFFQLPDRRRGPSLLNTQAIGRTGEAAHFRDRSENEDGLEILHFRASAVFPIGGTVSSISRHLSHIGGTVGSES